MDDAVVSELRELLRDMQGVSQDGRVLAARYAQLLQGAMEGYCDELDLRAQAILDKLGKAA